MDTREYVESILQIILETKKKLKKMSPQFRPENDSCECGGQNGMTIFEIARYLIGVLCMVALLHRPAASEPRPLNRTQPLNRRLWPDTASEPAASDRRSRT